MAVEDVDRRRRLNHVDAATSLVGDGLPGVLRQFICRFTETRVRAELAERRGRSLQPVSVFAAAGGLRVPSYRGTGGGGGGGGVRYSDSARPGRVEKILQSIIVQSLSEKVTYFFRHCLTSQFTPPARRDKTVLSASCLAWRCELNNRY